MARTHLSASSGDAEEVGSRISVPVLANRYSYFLKRRRDLGCWNVVSRLYRLRDPRSGHLMARAVDAIIARYDGLRLHTHATADSVRHTIIPCDELHAFREVLVPDALDDESSLAWIEEWIRQEQLHTQLSQELFRVYLFGNALRTRAWFCAVVHHVLVDALSFRLVIRDLIAMYTGLLKDNAMDPPPPASTRSFKLYCEQSVAFWLEHAGAFVADWLRCPWHQVSPLASTPLSAFDNTEQFTVQVKQPLTSVRPSQRFRAGRRAGSKGLADLIVAGVGRAYYRWTGHSVMHLAMVMHGRTDLGLQRPALATVGWISETVPLVLDVRLGGVELVRRVAALIEHASSAGRSFGVARYLAADCADLKGLPDAQMSLNVKLGDSFPFVVDSEVIAQEPRSLSAITTPETQRVFLMSGGVFPQSGRYWIAWDFSSRVFDADEVSQFTSMCDDEIGQLTELVS